MTEPEPMGWKEAGQWLSLGYDKPGPVVCRADLFRALTLARREKERADAIGVTVEVVGPDTLSKFMSSCEEVKGAFGYGDTPHEAEVGTRQSLIPLLKCRIGQLEESVSGSAARLALADKLAEAVGRLPLTGGPVVDALRAYREWPK